MSILVYKPVTNYFQLANTENVEYSTENLYLNENLIDIVLVLEAYSTPPPPHSE